MQKIEFQQQNKSCQIEYITERIQGAFLSGEFEIYLRLNNLLYKYQREDFNVENLEDYKTYIRLVELLF